MACDDRGRSLLFSEDRTLSAGEAGGELDGARQRVYSAEPSQLSSIRAEVAEMARLVGASEATVAKVRLGVSEAAANAVVHAYRDGRPAGDIRVGVEPDGRWLRVSVRDCGVGMSPRLDSPGAGLGLSLMATLAESCEISSPPGGGTEVVMRFDAAA